MISSTSPYIKARWPMSIWISISIFSVILDDFVEVLEVLDVDDNFGHDYDIGLSPHQKIPTAQARHSRGGDLSHMRFE